jgi:hypothetical protein
MFNLPKSSIFAGLEWTGPRVSYPKLEIRGDTYPITWADDNELYASSGDPQWGETIDGLDIERFDGATPDKLTIIKVNHMNDYTGWGGDGPKPTGMICVDGVIYLAFQNMLRSKKAPHSIQSQHGSDASIVYSCNKGWLFFTPRLPNIEKPMFPGYKFGGPAFLQHGKNNQDARDDFVYAISSDQWDNGSNLRLGRVPKGSIMESWTWQWVCAFDREGNPAWTNKLDDAIPVLSIHRWLGCPEMVWLPKLKRYLLLSWRLHADFSPTDGTDLIVLESPNPWGPFSLVHFEEYWEGKDFNPYCPRVPMKWVSDDNLSGHLLFSGSWHGPMKDTAYRASVRPFKLVLK